jgi:carbonic anhydrase
MNKHYFVRSLLIASLVLAGQSGLTAPEHPEQAPKVTPADALARLKAGNQRFIAGKLQHPHQNPQRRTELATGQRPFAIVLGCADSRTSPEVLFDQGLGDLFVIRVAGAQLIVVLGHQRCGAVQAAKETLDSKAEAPAHINSIVAAIQPAVEATRGADVEATIKANTDNVVRSLRSSEPSLRRKSRLERLPC